MSAFDYVMTLLSFVYALAIAHILATAGDLIGAGKRVRFSGLNAAWMLFSLLGVLAWWIGLWGLRAARAWTMDEIAIFFALAAVLYLETRLVCVRVPSEGTIDLAAFHRAEGRKYAIGYAVLAAATVVVNVFYYGRGGVADAFAKNHAVTAMFFVSVAAAIFTRRWVQIAAALAMAAMWVWYFAALQDALT